MDKKNLIHRLNRAQGQIEALKKIIENEENDCLKTLRLIKAVNNALKSFGEAYVSSHLTDCLRENKPKEEIEEGLKEVIHSAFSM